MGAPAINYQLSTLETVNISGATRCLDVLMINSGETVRKASNEAEGVREGARKKRFYFGLSPKLWVGGGKES